MNGYKELLPSELESNVFKLIGKDWMLISAQKDGKTNTMTASWGGLGVMWGKNVAFVVIRPQRYTKEFVDNSEGFSLTFFDEKYKKTLSYLGTVSGRDEDKISKSCFNVVIEKNIPFFEEARVVMFCKKLYAQDFEESCFIDKKITGQWYPEEDYHTLYIAGIEKILLKD